MRCGGAITVKSVSEEIQGRLCGVACPEIEEMVKVQILIIISSGGEQIHQGVIGIHYRDAIIGGDCD